MQSATAYPDDRFIGKNMLAGGIFFVLTFVASIPALLLYDPVLNNASYVLGAGHDTRIAWGAFLEVILMVANIGSATALFPILKRHSESVAISYVASRIVESTIIGVGIIGLLAVVTLRQDLGGANAADAAVLTTTASALVAVHDWTFLFGPAFCAGLGNGILLGFLMYKSGLMPRRLALLGLVGGPIAVGTAVAVLFGAYDQKSAISFIFTIPEIIWEVTISIWLVVDGIRRMGAGSAAKMSTGAPVPVSEPA